MYVTFQKSAHCAHFREERILSNLVFSAASVKVASAPSAAILL